MSNYKPLIYPFIIFFVISIFLNIFISPFGVNAENPNSILITSGLVSFITDYFATAIIEDFFYYANGANPDDIIEWILNLVSLRINFWALLPADFVEATAVFIVTNLIYWTNIPDLVLLPYLIVNLISIVYGVIKLILP